MHDSLELHRKDLESHAKSISALLTEIGQLKMSKAVEDERDKHLQERLMRIEKSIADIYSLGKWALFAWGGSMIAAVVAFIVNGGLHVSAP
ncbi:hypothetical protein NPA31_011870 [Aurantimonas sp. MSK8Z-1]|uniref:hypothetical protein n=1 Tax=Mangrovibrevibacter kandeliae TaxID=2968473 RepID=UPI002118C728|nr:hypothetical protein [Aurantimonas sp. MSK8Z-1]MCW4115661.1 hypothetical protein [Aurantimonas sp. MSK8Z-1]